MPLAKRIKPQKNDITYLVLKEDFLSSASLIRLACEHFSVAPLIKAGPSLKKEVATAKLAYLFSFDKNKVAFSTCFKASSMLL